MSEKVMTIIDGNLMIDYAYPCMMAEKALKALHEAMLANDYEKAIEEGLAAIAETKLCLNAIKDMKQRRA